MIQKTLFFFYHFVYLHKTTNNISGMDKCYGQM